MATLQDITVICDPPATQWSLADQRFSQHCDELKGIAAPGRRDAPGAPADAWIATGHQAYLWHPGIAAKYIAASQAAGRLGAAVLNVIVDQDVQETLEVDLPVIHDERLGVERLALADDIAAIPSGAQPPVDAGAVAVRLESARDRLGDALAVDVEPLVRAWRDVRDARSMADQVALVLEALMRPYLGPMLTVRATDLLAAPFGRAILSDMSRDARPCVECYNRAADDHRDAGIGRLEVEADRVELPVWLVRIGRPRRRVFAAGDGDRAVLVLDSGEPVDALLEDDARSRLAPRALLLTALMRSGYCDLFVHGRGGAVYDAVTEAWWRSWRRRDLAPIAVVSADVRLPFDVPVADRAELERAAWWAHHLPFNVDRALSADSRDDDDVADAAAKRQLLAHMDDDRDRRRRSASFARVHDINDRLVQRHAGLVAAAGQRLERAQVGRANAAIAARRDWCLALYPPGVLHALTQRLAHGGAAPASTSASAANAPAPPPGAPGR